MSSMQTTGSRRANVFAGVMIAAVALLAFVGPAAAIAAPVFGVSMDHKPGSGIAAGGRAVYSVAVSNEGDTETSGPATVEFSLPPGSGLEVASVTDETTVFYGIPFWDCSVGLDAQTASCTGPNYAGEEEIPIPAGQEACAGTIGVTCRILVTVTADSALQRGTVSPAAKACGGGSAGCGSATDPTPTWLSFDIVEFDSLIVDQSDNPYTQAGGHPYTISAPIEFTSTIGEKETGEAQGAPLPSGNMKDIHADLPLGLVGNPSVALRCTELQLTAKPPACPSDSQVGMVDILSADGSNALFNLPVYNMIPPAGKPAEFGFTAEGLTVVHVVPKVRSNGDYGITVSADDIVSQAIPIVGNRLTFWGVPADPSHDSQRRGPGCNGCASGLPEKAFLSMPTSCAGPITTTLFADSWQNPGAFVTAAAQNQGIDGCNALDFSPSLEARPTTTAADSPSGLDVDLHIPQNDDPLGTAEAHLRDTEITLPEGLVLNPSSANGLAGCSPEQVDLHGGGATNCPDASKVGTVEVDTPLVDHPLPGSVYVATPHDNPFDSLVAIYIVVDDGPSGTVIKLAGEVELDPQTGRLSTTVTDAPQLPFEDFKLHFKSGPGAPLRTPALCDTYATTSSLTPWSAPDSGPPATPSDSYTINQGPNGTACAGSEAARPNTPSLDAGSVSPIARAFSPVVVNLRRDDGTQQFSAVTLSPPPGLLGKLAGIPYCSDAALGAAAASSGKEEQANSSCPAASQVGTVTAAAGAGPAPYHAPGKAYLTGPYKGAPYGLAIVTPAVAGPFDLGTIVVRVALRVDPITTRITAVSDPIPTILEGIPLDVRSVQVRLDRPDFTLNGTSCDPSSFTGTLLSTLGQSAAIASPFQLGECSSLGFKPKLSLRLTGGTRRSDYPALRATLTLPGGSANIAKASVSLPHSEFLAQEHIGTVCTRVQYAAGNGGGAECPARSIYGRAKAFTPLLDYPLEGPVYLRANGGERELPDLVASLGGQIQVDVVGFVGADKRTGGLRTVFAGIPDAPVSKFVLEMRGGKKGLLVNSRNICATVSRATALFDGQNGKVADLRPALKPKCGKGGKAKKQKRPPKPAR